MILEVSKELEKYIIWEYPKERLREDTPKHLREEFEAFQKALEEYNNNY